MGWLNTKSNNLPYLSFLSDGIIYSAFRLSPQKIVRHAIKFQGTFALLKILQLSNPDPLPPLISIFRRKREIIRVIRKR